MSFDVDVDEAIVVTLAKSLVLSWRMDLLVELFNTTTCHAPVSTGCDTALLPMWQKRRREDGRWRPIRDDRAAKVLAILLLNGRHVDYTYLDIR